MKRALLIATLVSTAPRPAAASCSSYPELCGLDVTSTIEQPDLDRAVDVVLVGDGFTDVSSWHTKANSAIATFKAQSATTFYGAVPNVYNFHIVDVLSATINVSNSDLTDTALGMNTAATCGAITCIRANNAKVSTAALNAPDVDIAVAIANSSSGRANATLCSQLASGGSMRLAGLSPISHEMGHAAMGLGDEYEESALCDSPQPLNLVRRRNVAAESSCLKFSTTAGAGCVQGGMYCSTGVWRSASGCIMRSSGNTAPCPVCRRTIEEILVEKRTGTDVAEPWAVVSSPTAGATVSGEIDLRASLFDDWFAPVHVSFVIDGAFVGTTTTETTIAALPFDTRTLADGTHTIGVFADDDAGHAMPGLEHTFDSENGLPSGTLTVSITSPADGATVSQAAYVSATITGDGTAVLAILYVDGVLVDVKAGTKLTAAFLSWDAAAATAGAHTLVVGARDSGDTEYSSPPISVTVEHPDPCAGGRDGGSGGQPIGYEGGCVTIHSPSAWDGIVTILDLQYTISQLTLPASAELHVDGNPVTPNPLPEATTNQQRVFIDASGWTAGPHTIEVVVDDGAIVATSGLVPVVKLAPVNEPLAFIHPLTDVGYYVCGEIDLLLNAEDDVGVTELVLLDNGVPMATAGSIPDMVTWDAAAASTGLHILQARAEDADGNFGYGEISVRADCTPPTVTITEPEDGATVPTDVVVVTVDASDVGSVIDRRELWVDGVLTDTSTANDLFAVLDVGTHTLMVRVFDQADNSTDSTAIIVTAADCASTGCDDGADCTTDVCSPVGRCLHALAAAGCCSIDPDCDDGDACTTDTCNVDTCDNVAIIGCCNFGGMCEDGDVTTQDLCSGPAGTCSNPSFLRCDGTGDCDDGLGCTTDDCVLAPSGYCSHDWTPACCDSPADCEDDDPCTTATCDSGSCVVTDVPDCCVVSTDCDDGNICTSNICSENTCHNPVRSNCCVDDGDCVTYNPCATVSCHPTVHICQDTPIPDCCTYDFECTDWDACTADTCDGGACTFVEGGICCTVPGDCDDVNPCTDDDCDTEGFCEHTDVAGCCLDAAECDDGDLCTDDACDTNVCSNVAVAGCCLDHDDCDDVDVCTSDTCETNSCVFSAIGSCCHDANECDDGLACTINTCGANVCVTTPIPACCTIEADCDDADPCTTNACDAGTCVITAIPGCCEDAADCNDADICTLNTCEAGTCVDTPVAGCCTDIADCDDSDPCTADTCESFVCNHAGTCADGPTTDGGPADGAPATDGGPADGAPTTDGGTSGGDVSPSQPILIQGGCACNESSSRGSVALLALAVLGIRRRTSR